MKKKKLDNDTKSIPPFYIALFVVVIIATIGIINQNIQYNNRFNQATVNGIDISQLTVPEATKKINTQLATQKIELPNKTISVKTNASIPKLNHKLKKLLSKNNSANVNFKINNSKEIKAILLNKVNAEYINKHNANAVKPQSAKITYNKGKVQADNEIKGDFIKGTNINPNLKKVKPVFYYSKPLISQHDQKFKDIKNNLSVLNTFVINIKIKNHDNLIKYNELFNKIEYVDDNIAIEDSNIDKYVQDLNNQYKTVNKDIPFMDQDNKKQVVYNSGTLGWQLNTTQLRKNIIIAAQDAITNSKKRETLVINEDDIIGNNFDHNINDFLGNDWITINLSTQHMYIFKDKHMVLDTGIVSGNPNTNGATPTGMFYIVSKQQHTVLKGNNDDGSKYESPVDYYVPFVGNVIGLHDSPWQAANAYGVAGNENKIGSHGCINTPPNIMPKVFNIVEVNEPVVVYK